jgi:hypothetical protein
MDPTTKGPSNNRSTGPIDHDKRVVLEERLRAFEGNNLINPVLAAKVFLVVNIMVPKEFRALDFVKYTRLECLNTHFWSYNSKMVEMIHNDKMSVYFFQYSLTRSAFS